MSSLRSYQAPQDRQSAWDTAPPKHREPDESILEHERKRKVEVKCLELQLELEDNGSVFFAFSDSPSFTKTTSRNSIEGDQIEEQVNLLREKLLKNLANMAPPAKTLKASDTHAIAVAKKAELSKMASALGTSPGYQEGEAFDREKQEEKRRRRMIERQERERKREEDRGRIQAQRAKWAEKRERDRREREPVVVSRRSESPPLRPERPERPERARSASSCSSMSVSSRSRSRSDRA